MKNGNTTRVTPKDLAKYQGSPDLHKYTSVLDGILALPPELNRSSIRTYAEVVTGLIDHNNVNTAILGARSPRMTANAKSCTKAMTRLLENPRFDPAVMIQPIIDEIFTNAVNRNQTLKIIMDQTSTNTETEGLMISVKYKGRALPLLCTVVERNRGGIGYPVQRQLLDKFCQILAQYPNLQFVFYGDRFYGTQSLIKFCHQQQWRYCLRLRGNLWITYNGQTFKSSQIKKLFPKGITNAELGKSGIQTSIYMLQDKGHDEPWIIATDGKPTRQKAKNYIDRWATEPLFKDLKSGGFNITNTKLQDTDRIERLILCIAVAIYFCVALATFIEPPWEKYTAAKAKRSKLSQLQHGMRAFYQLWGKIFRFQNIGKISGCSLNQ